MRTCTDIGHGITWRDSHKGPGHYCRRCGGEVSEDDMRARCLLERIRAARGAFALIQREAEKGGPGVKLAKVVARWDERLAREVESLLGGPDPSPTFQAPKA